MDYLLERTPAASEAEQANAPLLQDVLVHPQKPPLE